MRFKKHNNSRGGLPFQLTLVESFDLNVGISINPVFTPIDQNDVVGEKFSNLKGNSNMH
jgi:hypothetical protein